MKALALISGGLDSVLAARVIKEQGIEVIPLNFKIPFCQRGKPATRPVNTFSNIEDALGAPVKRVDISEEFIKLLDKPRYGFGSNMNPCIDCKILMLSKAREMMKDLGASFVVTGEVLGQRPMSQHRQALELIENRSGLKGLLLRPLSAKLLDETFPEKEGWVSREKLLNFGGRTRRPQMSLAESFCIRDYENPAGGCLLTDPQFSRRLKELMQHHELKIDNIELLKVGRHFRCGDSVKLVVARNEAEGNELMSLAKEGDYLFMPAPEVAGPTCLGRGEFNEESLALAAGISLRYCDEGGGQDANIFYKRLPAEEYNVIVSHPAEVERLEGFRI